jgi:hypothetical protein
MRILTLFPNAENVAEADRSSSVADNVDLALPVAHSYGRCRELIFVKRHSFPARKLSHVLVTTEMVRFHLPLFIGREGC